MKNKSYFIAFIAVLIWGLTFIWSKIVLQHYSAISLIFMRTLISSVFLLVAATLLKKLEKIDRKDLPVFFLVALSQPFLYFIFESLALQRVSASITAIIISTNPLFTFIVGALVFKDKVRINNLLGILICLCGIGLMVWGGDDSTPTDMIGVLFLFLAVLCTVGYAFSVRKVSHKYNPVSVVTYQNLIGSLLFLPIFLAKGAKEVAATPVTSDIVVPLLCLALLGSTVAFICWTYSIKNMGVISTNMFTYLIPIVASIASFFLLDEQFTVVKIVGIAMVLGGLVVGEMKKKQ